MYPQATALQPQEARQLHDESFFSLMPSFLGSNAWRSQFFPTVLSRLGSSFWHSVWLASRSAPNDSASQLRGAAFFVSRWPFWPRSAPNCLVPRRKQRWRVDLATGQRRVMLPDFLCTNHEIVMSNSLGWRDAYLEIKQLTLSKPT